MNLKTLNDEELVSSHVKCAQTERDALSVSLHHFREVERRRLFSKLRYPSLKDYAMKHLKYSESEAWLRIAAMQLLKEVPEIEPKINSGTLQLTNLVIAKRAFGQEAKQARIEGKNSPEKNSLERTRAQKLEVIEKLENVSKNEAIKIIARETGVSVQSVESVRELSDGKIERKVIMDGGTSFEIDRLKGLLAHSHPNMSTGELIKLAVEALAREVDPLKKPLKKAPKTVPEQARCGKKTTSPKEPKFKNLYVKLGYIPAPIRRFVWKRDGGRCTNCGSTHAVQCEHIIPVAKGGESTIENVKLLCRSCNQRSAIEQFGLTKMESYLKEPQGEYGVSRRLSPGSHSEILSCSSIFRSSRAFGIALNRRTMIGSIASFA